MKIVIDLRMFGPSLGGLGRYNEKLLEYLSKLDKTNNYILLFKKDLKLDLPDNFKVKICNYHWYSLKEQLLLPFILYKLKPDLVHFTHFNIPYFYNGKYIVTIHDLIMTKFPSKRTSKLNRLFFVIKRVGYNLVIKKAVKKSINIIAVSKFTAEDIKRYFKLNKKESEKIKVIYEGLTIANNNISEDIELPKNYFLYIGNAYPHKNLEFLIEVFSKFIKKHRDYYLILVGKDNYFYNRLKQYSKKALKENKDKIIFTDFVPDKYIINYYINAKAYIFPSLYEGFGLPPLEAMNYNIPVLSSKESCLPEILEDSVLYFNPYNKEDLLNKMNNIINNDKLRNDLIIKGKKQIKKYSWSKMVKEILELYNK